MLGTVGTCKGRKKDGTPCQSRILLGNGYCSVHQEQARPAPAGANSNDGAPVTLADFIEENHRLLTVLGVFTAMTVFASNLPLAWPGAMLAFLFMALSVMLWLQLFARVLSTSHATTSMALFVTFFSMATLHMVLYWLLAFRSIWREYLANVLWILAFGASVSVHRWCVRRHKVLYRFYHPGPDRATAYRTAFSTLSLLVIVLLAGFSAFYGARALNRVLDGLYQDVTQPTPLRATATLPMGTPTLVPCPTPTTAASTTPTLAATIGAPTVYGEEQHQQTGDGQARRHGGLTAQWASRACLDD